MSKAAVPEKSPEISNVHGVYYKSDITKTPLYKIPKVESVVEHKPSKVEKILEEWLSKAKPPANLCERTDSKEKKKEAYDSIVYAMNSIMKKVKENSKDLSSIEKKVFSKDVPKVVFSFEIDDVVAAEIRKEETSLLRKEEQEVRALYEEIYKYNREMESEQVSNIKNDEMEKRKIIVAHQCHETKIKDEIQQIENRLEFLTINPPPEREELELLKQQVEAKRNELRSAKQENQKQLEQFENCVSKRKRKESSYMQKYFETENEVLEILQRKIVIREALEDDEVKKPNEASKVESSMTKHRSEAEPHEYKRKMDWRLMDDYDRQRMRVFANGAMMSNISEVINVHSYDQIQEVEGLIIGPEIANLNYATIRKARSELYGKENEEYAVKIFDYNNIDHDFEVQLRRHGFRVCSFIKDNPFKRLVSIHSLFQIAHEKAYLFEAFCPKTLQEELDEKGAKSEIETKRVMSSVMEAVNYLHSIGVAHQNISPDCILFSRHGHIKLAGLELSTLCWDTERQKVIKQVGKRPQMGKTFPLEVHVDDKYDPMKVDIYTCGTIVVNTMLKKYPFDGSSPSAYDSQWNKAMEELGKVCSNLCRSFVISCTKKDPQFRPESNKIVNHTWFDAKLD